MVFLELAIVVAILVLSVLLFRLASEVREASRQVSARLSNRQQPLPVPPAHSSGKPRHAKEPPIFDGKPSQFKE